MYRLVNSAHSLLIVWDLNPDLALRSSSFADGWRSLASYGRTYEENENAMS